MIRFAIPALIAVLSLACGGKGAPDSTTPDDTANPCANPCAGGDGDANPCANPCGGGDAADPALIARGAKIHEDSCSLCHGDDGSGSKKSPAIKGAGALAKFSTDAELFEYTKKEMPKDDPGSLSDDDYKAVVAWMRAQ